MRHCSSLRHHTHFQTVHFPVPLSNPKTLAAALLLAPSVSSHATQPPEPWQFYSTLRTINPAPYAAWLSLAASAAAPGITLCCSSPERFLSCGRGGVLEAKPIKGTARRHPGDMAADCAAAAALLGSEKERAENLMIVDLLRNDLGR